MQRISAAAALGVAAWLGAFTPVRAAAPSAAAPLLACLETIARSFHVRIVDRSGFAAPLACAPPRAALDATLDALLQPPGLAWRRLDDGTVEVIAAPTPARVQLPALDIEGDPVPDVARPEHPLATPLIERATAATSLDRRWLDSAPLLGFNQIGWFAPNVYGSGQSLAIRGTERDTDYFPALTITFDGIDLGTRLLDDELVPLQDVTGLDLARGPRTFEAGEGSQAGAIALSTAAPAAQATTSLALGVGNDAARNGAATWSGPLTSDLGATLALDRHELPGFVRQVQVPAANVAKRDNGFGRLKLRYAPDFGVTAQLAALALSGDSSDRQVVPPTPLPGQHLPPFDAFDRDSYATDPLVARTHARGAAGFVRYDAAHWSLDAHASVTTIRRDVEELPDRTRWSDHELRRREGVSVSESLAPDWTVVAGVERDHMATAFYTPIARQTILNYFATATDSAAAWVEHAWNGAWTTGLGVRWLYERATVYANPDGRGFGYRVPIPLAVIEWHPWTDHVFTASYGTGYRSGGQINAGLVTYAPERNENLELAWRAQWCGGALHTTLSAFDGNIRDRFTYGVAGPGDAPILARVRERGLEFELDAELSQRWRMRAGLGALSSRYSSLSYQFGDPTSEAPPQTAVLGLRYGLETGWYGALDAYRAAAARYYNPDGRLPPYGVLGLRAGYRSAHWDAALIASNAFDEHYVQRVQLSAANQTGYRLGDPRRVEARVKLSW